MTVDPLGANLFSASAQQARRNAWNERLRVWSRAEYDSEEEEAERTIRMVREALRAGGLGDSQIILQGSYHNRTNVRRQADVDIICCASIECHIARDGTWIAPQSVGLFLTGRSAADDFAVHRAQVVRAVQGSFGASEVDQSGSKAINVAARAGSRVRADVVPALALRLHGAAYRGLGSALIPRVSDGVILFTRNGSLTSFPVQHHERGRAKNNETNGRYKRAVRSVKWLRNEMHEQGDAAARGIPSHLIEDVLFNVPDSTFREASDAYSLAYAPLSWLALDMLFRQPDSWMEANGERRVFGSHQTITPDQLRAFVNVVRTKLCT